MKVKTFCVMQKPKRIYYTNLYLNNPRRKNTHATKATPKKYPL